MARAPSGARRRGRLVRRDGGARRPPGATGERVLSWYPVEVYEEHYLAGDDPRRQSGFGGDEERWEAARRLIVEAIDRPGSFLDVGCANGYLLESLVRWSPHPIEPYGLDFSARLVELARTRLPQWADRFFVGDALEWEPPRRFDFVRTELVYARDERRRELVERLLYRVVAPGGRLIVCGYGSPRSGIPADPVRRILRGWGYELAFELVEEAPEGGGPIVELAVPGVPAAPWNQVGAVAPTQEALYRDIDLELSWSERDLPERERTKHVHRLHPYLGKFIPQLVEALLARYFRPGGRILDPFAGSGTTLVQALESGFDAGGVDVAAFNALLVRVKTERYNLFVLERELRDVVRRLDRLDAAADAPAGYVRSWFAPQAARELLAFRELIGEYEHGDVLRVVLARAARSARRTTHFDLDFPRAPQRGPYWCHKHRRTCRPVECAAHFLRRYTLDTLERIKAFSRVRVPRGAAEMVHGDARTLPLGGPYDGVVTSPPYPGLIDYHEQHRYAYELLGFDDRRELEVGAAAGGTSRAALAAYGDGIVAVLGNVRTAIRPGAPVVIVVNDRRALYPEILDRAGLRLDERLRRHVNRRTGRRAGEFFEDILVARFEG